MKILKLIESVIYKAYRKRNSSSDSNLQSKSAMFVLYLLIYMCCYLILSKVFKIVPFVVYQNKFLNAYHLVPIACFMYFTRISANEMEQINLSVYEKRKGWVCFILSVVFSAILIIVVAIKFRGR